MADLFDAGRDETRYEGYFEDWWKCYPRKVGKRVAHKKYKQIIKELRKEHGWTARDAQNWLLKRTQLFASSSLGKGDYCPHPSTWLHQGRYDDDPKTWGVITQETKAKRQQAVEDNVERIAEIEIARTIADINWGRKLKFPHREREARKRIAQERILGGKPV